MCLTILGSRLRIRFKLLSNGLFYFYWELSPISGILSKEVPAIIFLLFDFKNVYDIAFHVIELQHSEGGFIKHAQHNLISKSNMFADQTDEFLASVCDI